MVKSTLVRDGTLGHEMVPHQREEAMIVCDVCGESKDCLQKEIEGKQYDICAECWNPLAQKLKGKGRPKHREFVFLPQPKFKEPEEEATKPLPGEHPKIWGVLAKK